MKFSIIVTMTNNFSDLPENFHDTKNFIEIDIDQIKIAKVFTSSSFIDIPSGFRILLVP